MRGDRLSGANEQSRSYRFSQICFAFGRRLLVAAGVLGAVTWGRLPVIIVGAALLYLRI